MLNNKISGGCTGALFDGVGTDGLFRGNEIRETKGAGVTLQGGAATHVASNHIRDCEGAGLVVTGLGTAGLLEGNTISGCKVGRRGGRGGVNGGFCSSKVGRRGGRVIAYAFHRTPLFPLCGALPLRAGTIFRRTSGQRQLAVAMPKMPVALLVDHL